RRWSPLASAAVNSLSSLASFPLIGGTFEIAMQKRRRPRPRIYIKVTWYTGLRPDSVAVGVCSTAEYTPALRRDTARPGSGLDRHYPQRQTTGSHYRQRAVQARPVSSARPATHRC